MGLYLRVVLGVVAEVVLSLQRVANDARSFELWFTVTRDILHVYHHKVYGKAFGKSRKMKQMGAGYSRLF